MAVRQQKDQVADATWVDVATRLGSDWQWTRRPSPQHRPDEYRGWLQGPDEVRLRVLLNRPRWDIHECLDAIIPETGELIVLGHLYAPGEDLTRRITLAKSQTAVAIAREIARRLLPSVRESLGRLKTCKAERAALLARCRQAREAILAMVPPSDQCPSYSERAPRLILAETMSLDLRIDDSDDITITRWNGLELDTLLRVIGAALSRG